MGNAARPSDLTGRDTPPIDGNAETYDAILQRIQAKQRRIKWMAWLSLLVSASLGVSLFVYAFGLSRTIDRNRTLIAQQRATLDSLDARIKLVTPAALQAYGWSAESVQAADSSRIGVSLQANDVIQSLRAITTIPSGLRVQYFAKEVDRSRENLLASLRQLGFSVIVKQPLNDDETNAIWVGDSVHIDVARLLGLAFVRAGYRIKQVARFRDSGGKELLVEIGRNPMVLARADLSLDEIKNMSALDRDMSR